MSIGRTAASLPMRIQPAAAPRREDFLGVPIDCMTMNETLGAVDGAIAERRLLHHVSLNVAKFVAMQSDAELARDVRGSHVVGIDGMGIVWAARLLGIAVPERVPGIDLMSGVLALCAEKGYRPYLLGARAEVLDAAVAALKRQHPTLTLAGWRDGYFKPAEEAGIVEGIRAANADCLFIGMPTPYKERFLAAHRERLGVPFVMGVGGSFDVLAGHVRRAPKAVQAAGGEWLFRLVQEPRRLAPRYVRTNLAFAGILAAALLHGAGAAPGGDRARARSIRLARSVRTPLQP